MTIAAAFSRSFSACVVGLMHWPHPDSHASSVNPSRLPSTYSTTCEFAGICRQGPSGPKTPPRFVQLCASEHASQLKIHFVGPTYRLASAPRAHSSMHVQIQDRTHCSRRSASCMSSKLNGFYARQVVLCIPWSCRFARRSPAATRLGCSVVKSRVAGCVHTTDEVREDPSTRT